jgi:Xaa-Pro aminopeptidase
MSIPQTAVILLKRQETALGPLALNTKSHDILKFYFSKLFKTLIVMVNVAVAVSVAFPAFAAPEQRFFDWTRLQFEADVYQQRRANLISVLKTTGEGIFLAPSRHGRSHGETFRQLNDFLYFTGLEIPDSVLAIDAKTESTILFVPPTDPRFEQASRPNDFPGRPLQADPELARVSGISEIRPYGELAQSVAEWKDAGRLFKINPEHPGAITEPKTDFVSHASQSESLIVHMQQSYAGIRIESAYGEMAQLRMIKGPEEIEALRRTCELTAQAIMQSALAVRDGVDERSLEAVLESAFKQGGGQRLSFSSIIKSGPNAMWAWRILASHYDRRNRVMRDGELVIFDVGAELDYYVSDVGRTFPVSGKFTEQQKQTMDMVTAVSDAIIAAVRPGVSHRELARIGGENMPPEARKHMQPTAFNGHHIGLDVSDPVNQDLVLAPGMVFTVEPIYYNHDENISVFIEDVVLVTEDGAEVLTRMLPRSTEGLEKLMRAN